MYLKGWYKTMKKEEFMKLGLDQEAAKKCEAASTEELKTYIPKVRFDEVNNDKKKLELDVRDRDSQLEKLKNSTGDVEGMKKQIEDLQKDNKKKDDDHKAEIHKMKVDAAVSTALGSAKAINAKAVLLFLKDMDKAEFDDKGEIKGLSEQLTSLTKAEDTKFLFGTQSKPKMKGAKHGEGGDPADFNEMTKEKFMKLNPVERFTFSQENPEIYKTLYEKGE